MNDWLKILLAFGDGEFYMYDYGLTLRFIVGGCQIPIEKKFETEEEAYDTTKQIFEEMQDFNSNGNIVVSNKCEIHNGPVMRLSGGQLTENSIATSFEEVWDRYKDDIIKGNYHINAKERAILEKIF
jgi:hypothetical protein